MIQVKDLIYKNNMKLIYKFLSATEFQFNILNFSIDVIFFNENFIPTYE